jgi:hypothetical protein
MVERAPILWKGFEIPRRAVGEDRGPGGSRTGKRAKVINAEMDVGPASSEPYLLSKLDSFNQEREKQQCQSARE